MRALVGAAQGVGLPVDGKLANWLAQRGLHRRRQTYFARAAFIAVSRGDVVTMGLAMGQFR